MAEYTGEERRIIGICEACRSAIMQEELARCENGQPPLSDLLRTIIYQRYQDIVVLAYPSDRWEEVSNLFDRLFKEIEDYHKADALVYA